MARLNKLDCEYTLEEAKGVDVNDITTHPFFEKHFAKGRKEAELGVRVSGDHDKYSIVGHRGYGQHVLLHYKPSGYRKHHIVELHTGDASNTIHYGSGSHETAHGALDAAIKDYKENAQFNKPLTESLVGKKPATASKLFAEAMETRLDEISKKLTRKYVEFAIRDRDKHIEDATHARASADALQNVRTGTNYVADDKKRDLRGLLGDMERKARDKKYKRERGIVHALDRLTKEDLDEVEARLDEISNKTLRSYISKSIDKEGNYHRSMITPAAEKIASRVSDSALINRLNYQDSHEMPRDPKKRAIAGITRDATHTELKNRRNPAHPMTNQPGGKQYLQGKDRIKFFTGKRVKEDLDEVEAPTNFWNAGMARMNPIQVSQKQPAEPGQFKATLTKSPKRLADQDSSLEGKPRAVRDETEATAASRGPKTIELTGDWHADVPDHQFDPKLDSETEYYPLFSQFKSLGAYPSGPARAWESEEIDEDELNEISKKTLRSYLKKSIDSKDTSLNNANIASHHQLSSFSDEASERYRKEKLQHKATAEKRSRGIDKAIKKLSEDSASLMAVDRLTKEDLDEDELNEISKELVKRYSEKAQANLSKHADEVDKLGAKADYHHDRAEHYIHNLKSGDREKFLKHQTAADKLENKISKEHSIIRKREKGLNRATKKLSEGSLEEGLFDPAKQPLLALWDEHARRSDAHGSGSRTEILKRIEDHVAKKHGQEGLKKMRLHSDLSNALKNSVSGDKGHLQALLGNMRAKCAIEQ